MANQKKAPANRVGAGGTPPPVEHQFKKGQSGNPSGRPSGYAEFRQKCREHTDDAINALVKNLKDPEGGVRNKAAETILAHGWGKPVQAVDLGASDGAPLSIQIIRRVAE